MSEASSRKSVPPSSSSEDEDNLDYYLSLKPSELSSNNNLVSLTQKTEKRRRASSVDRNMMLEAKRYFNDSTNYNIKAQPVAKELIELFEYVIQLVLTRTDRVGMDKSELDLSCLKSNPRDILSSSHLLKFLKNALNISDADFSQCAEKYSKSSNSKIVKISLISASNLKAKDGKSSSPYATICLGSNIHFEDSKGQAPAMTVIKKSKTVPESLNPVFNTVFEFNIDHLKEAKSTEEGNFTILLWTNAGKKIKFLGQAQCNVNTVLANEGVLEEVFTLQKRSSRSNVAGTIKAKFEYSAGLQTMPSSKRQQTIEEKEHQKRLYGYLLDALIGLEIDDDPKFDIDSWNGRLKRDESMWIMKEYRRSIGLNNVDKNIYSLSRLVYRYCTHRFPGNHLEVLLHLPDDVIPKLKAIEDGLKSNTLLETGEYALNVIQPVLEYLYSIAKSSLRNFREVFVPESESERDKCMSEFRGCLDVIRLTHALMRPNWQCFNVNNEFVNEKEMLVKLLKDDFATFFNDKIKELTEFLNAAEKVEPNSDHISEFKSDNITTYISNLNQAATKDVEKFLPPFRDIIRETIPDVEMVVEAARVYYGLTMDKVEPLVKLTVCDLAVSINADCFEIYRSVKALRKVYTQILKSEMSGLKAHVDIDNDDVYKRITCTLNLFEPVLSQWIECVSQNATDWVQRAVDEDTYEPISDTSLHSSAVVDIFGSFTQCIEYVDKLQWHNKTTLHSIHEPKLAAVVCDSLTKYVVYLSEKFGISGNIGYYEDDSFTVSTSFCVALNNLVQSFDELNLLKDVMQFSDSENDLFTEVYRRIGDAIDKLIEALSDSLEPQFSDHISYVLGQKLGRDPPPKVKAQRKKNPPLEKQLSRRVSEASGLRHIIEENEKRSTARAGKSKKYDKIVSARKKKEEKERKKAEDTKSETVKFSKFLKKNWNKLKDGKTVAVKADENKVLIALDPFLQFFNSILSIFAEYLYPDVLRKVLLEVWRKVVITIMEIVSPKDGRNQRHGSSRHLHANGSPKMSIMQKMNSQLSHISPQKDGTKTCITRIEAESLHVVLSEIFEFFHADGEGLPEDQLMVREYQKVTRMLNLMAMTTAELMMVYYRSQIDKPQSNSSSRGKGVVHYEVKKTNNKSVDVYIERATGLPNPDPGSYYSVAVRLRPDKDLEKEAIEHGTPGKKNKGSALKGFLKKTTNSKERDPNMNVKHSTEKKGKIGNPDFMELFKVRDTDHYSFKEVSKDGKRKEVNLDDMIIQVSVWLKNKLGKDKFLGESIIGVKELDSDTGEMKVANVSHPLEMFDISDEVELVLYTLLSRKHDKSATKFAKRRLLDDFVDED